MTAMPSTIQQQVSLPAGTKAVYEHWVTARLHRAFTGSRAVISQRIGGKFSVYDGYATGFHLFLKPGQRIVQAWRADDWSEGDHSVIDLHLHPMAGGRTLLTFEQTGVPDTHAEAIQQGWTDFYWTPLEAFLRQAAPRRRSGR
jgi:activator of HSP90 ATPase